VRLPAGYQRVYRHPAHIIEYAARALLEAPLRFAARLGLPPVIGYIVPGTVGILLEVFVAAKIFEVIAVVAIILFALVFAVALRFLAKFLKRTTRHDHACGEVRKQFDASIGGVDNARYRSRPWPL